jgi:hypothetical protein
MPLTDAWDFAAVCGLLLFASVLSLARRGIPSPSERIKMRAAAWSLLSDAQQPSPSGDGEAEDRRGSKDKRAAGR